MDKECGVHQILEINLTAGNGAEKIIQKIAASPLKEKLLLRNDKFLREEWYKDHLVNYLEFFSPNEGLADTAEFLEDLFPFESSENNQNDDVSQDAEKEEKGGECKVFIYQKQEKRWEERDKNPRIHLKIVKWPFQIPFVLELMPYEGESLPLEEKMLKGNLSEEEITYCMFTPEEYLSRSLYHIIDNLELIHSLSWYKDIYDILTKKVVEGRKVSQSFGQLLLENAIPSLKERLDIISSFEDYEYMEKRWKNYSKVSSCLTCRSTGCMDIHTMEMKDFHNSGESYPEWNQVIELLVKFFTPIFEMVQKDEVFIGDWMPQIGRYLD